MQNEEKILILLESIAITTSKTMEDVSILKSDVHTLKSDVHTLKSDVKKIDERLTNLEVKVDKIETKLDVNFAQTAQIVESMHLVEEKFAKIKAIC
jgi:hypothetical protein